MSNPKQSDDDFITNLVTHSQDVHRQLIAACMDLKRERDTWAHACADARDDVDKLTEQLQKLKNKPSAIRTLYQFCRRAVSQIRRFILWILFPSKGKTYITYDDYKKNQKNNG